MAGPTLLQSDSYQYPLGSSMEAADQGGQVPFWDNPSPWVNWANEAAIVSNAWNTVYFGSYATPSPGIANVFMRKRLRLDKKQPAGSRGQTQTVQGIDNAEIDIEIQMWTFAHWQRWLALLSVLLPVHQVTSTNAKTGFVTAVGGPVPIKVSHPAFAGQGIDTLFIMQIGTPVNHQCIGVKYVTIRALEFLPVTPMAVTTPTVNVHADISSAGQQPQPANPIPFALPGSFAPPPIPSGLGGGSSPNYAGSGFPGTNNPAGTVSKPSQSVAGSGPYP